jgi:hypothetical protein
MDTVDSVIEQKPDLKVVRFRRRKPQKTNWVSVLDEDIRPEVNAPALLRYYAEDSEIADYVVGRMTRYGVWVDAENCIIDSPDCDVTHWTAITEPGA